MRRSASRTREGGEAALDRLLASEVGASLFAAHFQVSFAEVLRWVESREPEARSRLHQECRKLAKASRVLGDESVRVYLAKILIALLPDTRATVRQLLRRSRNPVDLELHFSLFSVLDTAVAAAPQSGPDVVPLIAGYLREARVEASHAPWMAGELLGERGEPAEAFEVLCELATAAPFVVGRLGAIHGLGVLRERAPRSLARAAEEALREVTRRDRSKRARQYARSLLESGRGARRRSA